MDEASEGRADLRQTAAQWGHWLLNLEQERKAAEEGRESRIWFNGMEIRRQTRQRCRTFQPTQQNSNRQDYGEDRSGVGNASEIRGN